MIDTSVKSFLGKLDRVLSNDHPPFVGCVQYESVASRRDRVELDRRSRRGANVAAPDVPGERRF